ncbi:hypothetical protein GQ53DRAFT_841855 [Thozetella sp. PMI_491]|nr:hypothetical protein GQ53DRAFT_841855 [Thozetella sp. PMI_491]
MACTLATCDPSASLYGYQPALASNAAVIAVLCLCLVACLAVGVLTRQYLSYTFLLTAAYVFEIVAFAERIKGQEDPWDVPQFGLEVLFSTTGPVFATMSITLLVVNAVRALGQEHSPLSARLYSRLFIPVDAVAVVIQGLGLAIMFADSSPAAHKLGPSGPSSGKFVVVAGLALQLLSLLAEMILFIIVCARAFGANRRYGHTTFHSERGYVRLRVLFRILLVALPVVSAFIMLRGAYQILAFANELKGDFATNENYFLIANGAFLIFALAALGLFHPTLWLHVDMRASSSSAEVRSLIESTRPREKQRRRSEAVENLEEVSTLLRAHHRSISAGSSAMSEDVLEASGPARPNPQRGSFVREPNSIDLASRNVASFDLATVEAHPVRTLSSGSNSRSIPIGIAVSDYSTPVTDGSARPWRTIL